MYSVTINGKSRKVDLQTDGGKFQGMLNGNKVEGDIVKLSGHTFHMLYKNKSYNVEVLDLNREEKSMLVRVNGAKMSLSLKDKYDELLHQLGFDEAAGRKVNDIKAPMPGMVLNILVKEGEQVKKGDALLVLEAMKMENILKSPSDGTVKRVVANKGTAVEKNQLLIQF